MERTRERQSRTVSVGEPVFNSDGTEIGRVRSIDSAGISITEQSRMTTQTDGSTQHIDGVMYLMWHCLRCGELGKLTGSLPDHCPNCQAEREYLYYWAED